MSSWTVLESASIVQFIISITMGAAALLDRTMGAQNHVAIHCTALCKFKFAFN